MCMSLRGLIRPFLPTNRCISLFLLDPQSEQSNRREFLSLDGVTLLLNQGV